MASAARSKNIRQGKVATQRPVQPRHWMASAAARFAMLVCRWSGRRRQRLDLAALSDWQLRDLGLTRDAAMEEARRPFWL